MLRFLPLLFFFLFSSVFSQKPDIYYKYLNDSLVNTFDNDTTRIEIPFKDPLHKYKNYFNYVMCFYPKITYNKLYISSGKTNKIAKVTVRPLSVIAAPEDRNYYIKFSRKAISTLDTVTFFNLSTDSKIALISKQISMVEVHGNSGFFELFGLFSKKRSTKSKGKALQKEVNLYSIEAGLGYQLMTYTSEVMDKLLEDNWSDKKLYKKFYFPNTFHLMDNNAIRTYMYDYPVYLHNIYK